LVEITRLKITFSSAHEAAQTNHLWGYTLLTNLKEVLWQPLFGQAKQRSS